MSHVHVVMRLRSHRCHLELMNNHIKKMQEVQETNSELLRATNKELRHYKDTAALCPITQEPITNEVVNVVDGFKYERSGECLFHMHGGQTLRLTPLLPPPFTPQLFSTGSLQGPRRPLLLVT